MIMYTVYNECILCTHTYACALMCKSHMSRHSSHMPSRHGCHALHSEHTRTASTHAFHPLRTLTRSHPLTTQAAVPKSIIKPFSPPNKQVRNRTTFSLDRAPSPAGSAAFVTLVDIALCTNSSLKCCNSRAYLISLSVVVQQSDTYTSVVAW